MQRDCINIVAACDENFVQHLGVMLSSLLRSNPGESIRTFVLTTASDVTFADVRRVAGAHNCDLVRINFDASKFTSLPRVRHISQASYFRLAIPEVLAPDVSRVVYLDCDVIVRKPIRDLWQIDLHGAAAGAVADQEGTYDLGKLQLPPNSPYFNSGVLLIDVDAWRRESIGAKALSILQQQFHRITWADQCALNIALHGRWRELPCRWNLLTPMLGRMTGSAIAIFPNAPSLLDDAAIIHYSTHSKPWHYENEHPAKHLYWEEIRRTPWRRARQTGRAGYIARRLLGTNSPLIALGNSLRQWKRAASKAQNVDK